MTVVARPLRGRVQRTSIRGQSAAPQRASRRITWCNAFKPRKRPDYAARRAGGEQENLRRAQSHRESPPPAQQSSSYEARSFEWGADTGHSDSWSSERRPVSPDPRIVRRRSVDYASRRSGGDPENQRRSSSPVTQRRVSRDPAPQNGSYSSYTSNTSPSSLHPPQGGPKMDPRVQRRKSVNYEARRSGSTRGRSAPVRRSSSRRVSTRQVPSEPLTNANPTQYRSSSSEPHVLPRKSVDYSARRTGGDPENARRRIAASPGSAASRNPAPSVIQRKSVDYASRRSGGQEENLRRRSQDFSIPPGSGAPPQVPVTASEALERVRQLASRRRSVPDYASRRSSASAQEYNTRHRSTSSPPAPSASAPASSNGAAYDSNYSSNNGAARRAEERANKPYIARKSVPSYASRRSQDFPGRPGDPRRRRSMARFTLAEVKTALANRKRSLSGAQRSASAGPSRNGNGARPSALDESIDYGAHAMRSFEQLMGAYSDLAGVPMHQLKADLSTEYRFPYGHDPAEGALKSLEKVASLIAQASPAAGSRW